LWKFRGTFVEVLQIVEVLKECTKPSLFAFLSMASATDASSAAPVANAVATAAPVADGAALVATLASQHPELGEILMDFVLDAANGKPVPIHAPLPVDLVNTTLETALGAVLSALSPYDACLNGFASTLLRAIFSMFPAGPFDHAIDWHYRQDQLKIAITAIKGTAAFDRFATDAARSIFMDGVCWGVLSSLPTPSIIAAVDYVLKRASAALLFSKQIAWQLPHSEAVQVFSASLKTLAAMLKDKRNRVYNANAFFNIMGVVSPTVDHVSFLEALVDLELPTADELRSAGNMVHLVLKRWHEEQSFIRRILCIYTMAGAWRTWGGKPTVDAPPSPLGALLRAFGLRRLCRVRGDDSEGMPNELVEPFARDVVRFL
jgi:hypothetical protein